VDCFPHHAGNSTSETHETKMTVLSQHALLMFVEELFLPCAGSVVNYANYRFTKI